MEWPPTEAGVRIRGLGGGGPTRIAINRRLVCKRPSSSRSCQSQEQIKKDRTDNGLAVPSPGSVMGWQTRYALSWLVTSVVTVALTGCGAKLPDCRIGLPKPGDALPRKSPKSGQQVLVGIDGSGSMLGFAQASEKGVWSRLLQSISQGILLKGLQPLTYRIGAGEAEGPIGGSMTEAVDPCFFKGCGGFKPVASSLETIWTVQSSGNTLPLRLLVSDLEVNQNDVSSLLGGIQSDLNKGASAGILGIKAPFTGDVYGANSKIIYKGKTSRPLFILATGPKEQVAGVLNEIKKTLALKGITNTRASILKPTDSAKILDAQWITGIPATSATAGINVRFDNETYSAAQNSGYQFIKLNSGATGFSVATSKKWNQGTERPDIGIADLEKLSVNGSEAQPAEGMQISNVQISGSNIRIGVNVDQSAASGIYRIVIPAGSMPEQWWIDWDRPQSETSKIGEKTQGLLLLMTTLSRQIVGSANGPPAAAMCIALQNQS